MEESTESISEKLPLPKLEAYYEAPKKQYWIKDNKGTYFQVNGEAVIKRLDAIGYSAKPPKGRRFSPADDELENIRMDNNIVFAGAVASNMPGFKTGDTGNYLVTRGPKLVEFKEGAWDMIEKLGQRLFGETQWPFALSWCHNAVRGLYRGEFRPGQMLVLAGPPGCGKSFWQNRIITPMLGGRHGKPLQFMSGSTTFNADLIASEHLMLEDEISKTDYKSRSAFGSAVKTFIVNPSQRLHGKGDNGFMVGSKHWMSMSVNDERENLAILPPLELGILDKLILAHCTVAIDDTWPGDKKAIEALHSGVIEQMPAFIYYLLTVHKVPPEIADDRYGVAAYLNPELVNRINAMSPESELEYLIDACWGQMAKEGKVLSMASRDMQHELVNHPNLRNQAQRLIGWRDKCGEYLGNLAKRNPAKFIAPPKNASPRIWQIDWSADHS